MPIETEKVVAPSKIFLWNSSRSCKYCPRRHAWQPQRECRCGPWRRISLEIRCHRNTV